MENEYLSTFAFNTAKKIEHIINKETKDLKFTNQLLEGRILDFYCQIKEMNSDELYRIEDTYKQFFNIQIDTKGNI